MSSSNIHGDKEVMQTLSDQVKNSNAKHPPHPRSKSTLPLSQPPELTPTTTQEQTQAPPPPQTIQTRKGKATSTSTKAAAQSKGID
ncbi:hypothetical protein MJO28_014635 [Puccinia striiformis f. sp. tritici]|uniref:Uncharacterized protein n=1 Tax=Puccinia striiformis f. sp. tritici TaxID=168172 RepID=A0ACC0DVC5_9BASI|nr:hypothetical protein MJO28_014635 [Puccinia striiformis f. sp. tritici]